eukprot:scaffold20771_cov54-Phaeocystis_antarctica.AAC.2
MHGYLVSHPGGGAGGVNICHSSACSMATVGTSCTMPTEGGQLERTYGTHVNAIATLCGIRLKHTRLETVCIAVHWVGSLPACPCLRYSPILTRCAVSFLKQSSPSASTYCSSVLNSVSEHSVPAGEGGGGEGEGGGGGLGGSVGGGGGAAGGLGGGPGGGGDGGSDGGGGEDGTGEGGVLGGIGGGGGDPGGSLGDGGGGGGASGGRLGDGGGGALGGRLGSGGDRGLSHEPGLKCPT